MLETLSSRMNPSTVDQRHIKTIIDRALEKCINEQANTEFLVQVKKDLLIVTQQGRAALSDEFFDQPVVLNDGEIIIPSPRQIFEYEEQFHQNSLNLQIELLEQLKDAAKFIKNLLRRHNQNFDYKYQNFIQRRRKKWFKNHSATSSSHG